jgi:hypothetical protein
VSPFYELIGRVVMRMGLPFVARMVWWRFGTQIKLAAGLGFAASAVAGYLLATREPPEG